MQLGAHIGETVQGTNHFTDYYVIGIRNGYYIIDLSKMVIMLRYALRFLRKSSTDGCSVVLYYSNTHSYEMITLFLYKLSKLFPLNILYYKWIPGGISNYYSCFYDLLNEIQDLNWVDSRRKIAFIDIFFKLLYYISIDKPVDLTLEEQYMKSLSYWRAVIFFRYFRNYYYLPDVAICVGSMSNKIYHEFSSLGIPVVAPLNTRSNMLYVSYPIISNNSSVLLSLFYISLFSSVILEGRRIKYSYLFREKDYEKMFWHIKEKMSKLAELSLLKKKERMFKALKELLSNGVNKSKDDTGEDIHLSKEAKELLEQPIYGRRRNKDKDLSK